MHSFSYLEVRRIENSNNKHLPAKQTPSAHDAFLKPLVIVLFTSY